MNFRWPAVWSHCPVIGGDIAGTGASRPGGRLYVTTIGARKPTRWRGFGGVTFMTVTPATVLVVVVATGMVDRGAPLGVRGRQSLFWLGDERLYRPLSLIELVAPSATATTSTRTPCVPTETARPARDVGHERSLAWAGSSYGTFLIAPLSNQAHRDRAPRCAHYKGLSPG